MRGSALLTVVMLSAILLMMVIALLSYSSQVRQRQIQASRTLTAHSAGESGLLLARTFFSSSAQPWSYYLQRPEFHNPVGWSAAPGRKSNPKEPALLASNPELFADLDGDGRMDVYIYCRDNADEPLGIADDPTKDVDQRIVVGAAVISETLVPRRQDGTIDPDLWSVEALLSADSNGGGCGYFGKGCSATGNENEKKPRGN
jgi:hypothetical protein